LASASKTGVNLTWVYDRFGNRWQQNGPGGPNPQYTIDTNNHIVGSGVTYDVLGNVLNDGAGHSFTYDAENRVMNANGTAYVYDAFGRRVKNGAYEFLYDLEGNGVALLDAGNGGWAYGEIYAGGRHLATYSGGTTNFLHTDWLGTKRAMSSVSGAQSMTCTGLPFGESSSCATSWNFNSFTDDFHDSESNTEHTLYRQLSTTQGRWLSPDPYSGSMNLTNPQSLNRYAYVNNNPMNATDPTGLVCVWDDGSFDSPDDQSSGNYGACASQGGTWFDNGWFAGQGFADWSPNPNSDLAGLVNQSQNGRPDATVYGNVGDLVDSLFNQMRQNWLNQQIDPVSQLTDQQRAGLILTAAYNQAVHDLGCAGLGFAVGGAGAATYQLGQPVPGTKPFVGEGSSVGTSPISSTLRDLFPQKLPMSVPTPVGGPGTGTPFRIASTNNLGAVAGRYAPFAGMAAMGYSVYKMNQCFNTKP